MFRYFLFIFLLLVNLFICNICFSQPRELFYFKDKDNYTNIDNIETNNKNISKKSLLVLSEGKIDLLNYNLIAYIDCGKNDFEFNFESNAPDVGRMHYEKDYTQAAICRNGFWSWDQCYFSYKIPLKRKNSDILVVFLDSDNATRQFKITVNSQNMILLTHLKHTSFEFIPDSWKQFNLFIDKDAINSNLLLIKFQHTVMPYYPPSFSDIWVYEKINNIAYDNSFNKKINL